VPAPWRLNPGGAPSARIGNPRPRALGVGALGGHGQPARRGGSACRAGEFTDLPERRHWHAGAGCAGVRMV